MQMFNAFLNQARQTGTLEMTPVRLGGPTPNVDLFAQKLHDVVRRSAPEVKMVHNKPINLQTAKSDAPADRQVAAIARDVSKRAPIFAWSDTVAKAFMKRNVAAQAPVADDHMLHEFASLHAMAYRDFEICMTAAPAGGRGIAGGMAGHVGSRLQLDPLIASPTGFAMCVDSVYLSSFADAYALLTFANRAGAKQALEMAGLVKHHRHANGDYDRFSQSPQSADSEAAINLVEAEIKAGAVYGKLGRDNLVGHAMGIAAEAVGQWMHKHGASPALSDGISDTLDTVGKGYRAATARLQAGQEQKETMGLGSEPPTHRGPNPRLGAA